MFSILNTKHTHRHGVDVRLVARERLLAHAIANVPKLMKRRRFLVRLNHNKKDLLLYLCGSVAGAGDEGSRVGGERQRHDVAGVPREGGALLPGLNVPQGTSNKNHKWLVLVTLQIHSKSHPLTRSCRPSW